MRPSIWWLVATFVVACKTHKSGATRDNNKMETSSTSGVYRLTDSYNSTNFFDKFDFFESMPGTAHYPDVDPTNGFVLYQNQSEAHRLGLVQTTGDISIIRVDTSTVIEDPTSYGRKSVRLQSITRYNHGLFIADFSNLPPPLCGAWPAFWMSGPDWPKTGEIDIYEQWNNYKFNRQTLHTNVTVGNCTFNSTSNLGLDNYDMANHMHSKFCDVRTDNYEGCSTWDYEGPFGSADGGVYAVEWTSSHIKMWTWHSHQVPSDVVAGQPDPSTWTMPGLVITSSVCDIDTAFQNQSILFNIDFCGDTAGTEWTLECAEQTGYSICARYVAAKPGDFENLWFGVRTIAVYTLKEE